jgi:uncharacterized protein (DUF488 family)
MRGIFTVGHSTLPFDSFARLIGSAGVEAVADVRRYPGSRRHPHFGREPLARSLAEYGIAYEHFSELGGRRSPQPDSPNSGWTQTGFRGYADHLRSPEFATGLGRLEHLAEQARTAVMCAEGTWWHCHRRLLADVLVLRGWEVEHLLPDGRRVRHDVPEFAVRGADGFPLYPAGTQASLWSA